MSTTLTRTNPSIRRVAAAPPSGRPAAELGLLAAVGVDGSLRLLPVPGAIAASVTYPRRRAATAVRLDLGDGISCWLDSDQQDGAGTLNWVATGVCTSLTGGVFAGPHDAPFVCGLALFAGTSTFGAVGLSEPQLRRIVDVHAAAEEAADAADDASRADATVDFTRSLLASA